MAQTLADVMVDIFVQAGAKRCYGVPGDFTDAVRLSDLRWVHVRHEEARAMAAPGPALPDVVVDRNELVMPVKIEPSKVFGMALYSAKGILAGGVIGLIKDAITT